MATRFVSRFQLTKQTLTSLFSPSLTPPRHFLSTSAILRLRPIASIPGRLSPPSIGVRSFATRQTSSSLNDQNPNWSNRPPKETILLDGCDFEHWLVVMEKPEGEPTRDDIIDSYIKTLASVVGSEDEARMKIYSVSTRCYYAFGALVSEELSYKIKELPRVRWVLPDSYLDVRNKDYGGEPFIDGKAVPYDPKYHEEWIRNNSKANERNRRNDRPRNNDRSRNFDRRRENMQNRDFQNREPPMGGGGGGPPPPPPPHNAVGGGPPPLPPMGGMPPPLPPMGGMPPPPPPMGGGPMPPPPHNMGGGPPRNMGGGPPPPPGPNPGWSNNAPNYQNRPPPYQNAPNSGPPMSYQNGPNNGPGGQYQQGHNSGPPMSYQNGPNNGPGMGYQGPGGPGPVPNREYQNNYAPNQEMDGRNNYQTRDMPGRDMPLPPPNYQ